jgi:methanogenic corrinoid protein MtbC1
MVMAQLLARSPVAKPNGRTIVVSAVEGDTHDIGLHVAADFLEIAGWRVIFLGNNMPPGDLVRAVDDFEADVLALSATLPSQRRNVAQTINLLRAQADRATIPVLVGGRAFAYDDTAWRDVGAHACATNADDAVSVANSLVNGQ